MPTFISRSSKEIPDAFHGTSRDLGERIIKDTFKKTDGLRASGVYFWEGSEAMVKWWARKRYKQNKIAVLRATVQLGFCLDLTISEHADEVQKLIKAYSEKFKIVVTDKQAVTMVANLGRLDSVRAVQYPNHPRNLSPESQFVRHTRIIICVRNLDCVQNVIMSYNGM